ncbi:MAG: hypothetical protein U0892_22900 [Pirellulales bacterium]
MRRRERRKSYSGGRSPRLITMVSALLCLGVAITTLRSLQHKPQVAAILPDTNASWEPADDDTDSLVKPSDSDLTDSLKTPATDPPVSSSEKTGDHENGTTAGSEPAAQTNADASSGGQLVDESKAKIAPPTNLSTDPELKDFLGLVRDNALVINRTEMPSYYRFLKEAKTFTHDELYEAANKKHKFDDLYSHAATHRGELIGLDVSVWRVNRFDVKGENVAGLDHVYEVWGVTKQSQSWMYVFLVPEIPAWVEENVHHRPQVRFAGYFYKLQAYHSGKSTPGARPLVAPLLIGRFKPEIPTTLFNRAESDGTELWTVLYLGLGAGLFLTVFIGFHSWKLRARRKKSAHASTLKVVSAPEPSE